MDKNKYENAEQNDEKELDSLFDNFKNTKLKKAIKKAQWHSILRNALVSVAVMAVILVAGSIANRNINYKLEWPTQIAVDSFNEISAPNKYIGEVSRYHNILGGKNEYTTYKIIEGKVVYSGEGEYSYGLFRNERGNWIGSGSPLIIAPSWDTEDLEFQRYNKLGQREMLFFYPFIDYLKYKDDLKLLENMGPNKIMEYAISFDQAYSLEAVNDMFPDDITVAWYWIDDLNEQEKQDASKGKMLHESDGKIYELEHINRIRSEHTAYGIKAYNNNGEPLDDPLQHFIWALKNGMKYDSRFKFEFERVYNNTIGEDGGITHENINVWGVVVTGDVESLKALNELSFIKTSSLGVVTEKY
ncbi:MAG: hypothetical protein VR72_03845 [Clostridiaceae bacterium BRH_c20a]|nr:MAG: hypothetical protein VR72_03845 [Clostridiaceae bacterium BRH_c20a]